ncbi:dynein light intermediate chain [Niveomyces insectorum RCEF 264]|uniref:Dynein light intermediate chain n=1 Tax=Niveomyces insectorum RCEF 264 TaxID=1081102 RepID=A0A167T5F0_9HYPO|nr:dynein light intermediate chain [Niveomyces insectorum RCEF 264]
MTANTNTNRFSTYTSVSAASGSKDNAGGGSGGGGAGSEKKKDLWSSMLDSVASGRRLPERNVLVFGGSVDSQREFLESLAHNDPRRNLDRQPGTRLPPVANNLALGYTYYDVLDADQEDILARISLYLLSRPSPAFSALLQPLLTPQSIPNTLIVILLDWGQPWGWLRQLREWILLLRTVLVALSPECKEVMEEAMLRWRERGRGGPVNLDGTTAAVDGDALPPGPGEWEDALGLPLCVVCQNSEKTDILEKTQGWKDDEFDLVLQYLRTVLVKHGASLIYTTPNVPSQLPTLVHACLGVTSLLKRQPLKPEVIKRTEVVVPSNWDSWTKILVVREGFEVEKVSTGWSKDLQRPFPSAAARTRNGHDDKRGSGGNVQNGQGNRGDQTENGADSSVYDDDDSDDYEDDEDDDNDEEGDDEDDDDEDSDDEDDNDLPDSAVAQFERAIRDPGLDALALAGHDPYANGLTSDPYASLYSHQAPHHRQRHRRQRRVEVETEDVQTFLGEQLKLLEQYRQKDEAKREKEAKEAAKRRGVDGGPGGSGLVASSSSSLWAPYADSTGPSQVPDAVEGISKQIGPVQFNMGGIQVDADDMLERIKNRHFGSASPEPTNSERDAKTGSAAASSENVDTEKMTAFFAGLMNRPSHTGKT